MRSFGWVLLVGVYGCVDAAPAVIAADGPYAVAVDAAGGCAATAGPMVGPWDLAASGPLIGAVHFLRQPESTVELQELQWRIATEPGGTLVYEGQGPTTLTWTTLEDGSSEAIALIEFAPSAALAPLLSAGAPLAASGAKLPFYFELAAAADDGSTAASLAMAPELCNGCLDAVPTTAGVQVCASGAPVGCSAALQGAFTCGGTP